MSGSFGFWLPLLIAGLMCPLDGLWAQQNDPVQRGRDSLQRSDLRPWYDSDSDSLKRIEVHPPSDLARNRNSAWESQPKKLNTLPRFDWLAAAVRYLAISVLALLIGLLVVFLVQAYLRSETRAARLNAAGEDIGRLDDERIESLPFDVKRTRRDLLGEAEALYRQGRYNEAIIYYYSYQLVELDKHHVIRLTKGKTNRQYLWETRRQSSLATILEGTMLRFEDVFFGEHDLSQAQFEECWNRRERFQQLLTEQVAA